MTGTILNAAGILIGGVAGLTMKRPMSPANQLFFKAVLGALTVYFGLRLTWVSLSGSFLQVLKQLVIVVLAMMLGKLTGQFLRLQKASNRIGRHASERFSAASAGRSPNWGDGFNTCALLFCAAPLALIGSVHDGLSAYFFPLLLKGLMDGLATMSFVSAFGWSVLLSALPVLVYQGTITLVCAQYARPFLEDHRLLDPVNATGGLLVFCVALIIFEAKKISLADYLPSLAFAPLLTWLWR